MKVPKLETPLSRGRRGTSNAIAIVTIYSSNTHPLRGKTVVVVGGTSGMGLGAVREAANAGAQVIVGRRTGALRQPIEFENSRLKHTVVDVSDENAVRKMFDEIGALDHFSKRLPSI